MCEGWGLFWRLKSCGFRVQCRCISGYFIAHSFYHWGGLTHCYVCVMKNRLHYKLNCVWKPMWRIILKWEEYLTLYPGIIAVVSQGMLVQLHVAGLVFNSAMNTSSLLMFPESLCRISGQSLPADAVQHGGQWLASREKTCFWGGLRRPSWNQCQWIDSVEKLRPN